MGRARRDPCRRPGGAARLDPYWWDIHGIERPHGSTADDAAAAIGEAGYDVGIERWERSRAADRTDDERVAFARRHLCLGPERDGDIRRLLDRYPPPAPRSVATLWWSPGG